MNDEYHEGPKAGENFKKLAAAVLQKLVPHVSLLRHGKARTIDQQQIKPGKILFPIAVNFPAQAQN